LEDQKGCLAPGKREEGPAGAENAGKIVISWKNGGGLKRPGHQGEQQRETKSSGI